MKRISFSNLKTFLNTKFWLFSSLSDLSFEELGRQLTLTFESERQSEWGFGDKRLKHLKLIRFLKTLNNTGGSIRRRLALKPDLALRLMRIIRFIRSSYSARRYWWRLSRKFKTIQSFRKLIRVFKFNSFWRYPYSQQKLSLLAVQNSKMRAFNLKKRRSKFLYLPRQLSKRLRVFYFLNRGFWRSLDNLIYVRVRFTLNNLFVTLSNNLGKNFVTFSSGGVGFKGTTKLTSYAIEKVALSVSKFLKKRRLRNIYLIFNSGAVGYKSKIFIETLIYNSLILKYLTVSDAVPHNGVRPRKTKRR